MPLDQQTTLDLIARHGGALLALARSWTSDGEDLVQEAFCKLVVADPQPNNPTAWLFQVVRNEAKQLYRSTQRRVNREIQVAKKDTTTQSTFESDQQQDALQALDKIPLDLREIVIMKFWGEMTLEEISTSCDVSVATAHRKYKKAVESIQRHMGLPQSEFIEQKK